MQHLLGRLKGDGPAEQVGMGDQTVQARLPARARCGDLVRQELHDLARHRNAGSLGLGLKDGDAQFERCRVEVGDQP